MRNNSSPRLVSVEMFNQVQRLAPILFTAICATALISGGCKKKSGDASDSGNSAPITGKVSDAPVSIKPSWKSGNKYLLRLERTQVGQPGAMGGGRHGGGPANNAPVETTYAQEYTLTITNAEAGNRGAELEITGMELQSGRGEETFINYDSQNKAAPRDQSNPISTAIVGALDKLIGGKVRYLLSADGTVQKVEGVNELFARADGTNAQPGGRAFAPSAMLRRTISEDTFKQMVELNGAPDNEMKVGESWPFNRLVDAPMAGKLSVNLTNTLRGWQEHDGVKCARVEFTGTVTSTGGGNAPGGGRITITDGQVSGHYWYDPAIGLSREMMLKQTYTVSGAGFGGGRNTNNAGGTNQFSSPVKESVSVKLLEVKPAG